MCDHAPSVYVLGNLCIFGPGWLGDTEFECHSQSCSPLDANKKDMGKHSLREACRWFQGSPLSYLYGPWHCPTQWGLSIRVYASKSGVPFKLDMGPATSWLLLGNILHFACCGFVVEIHLPAKTSNIFVAPLPTFQRQPRHGLLGGHFGRVASLQDRASAGSVQSHRWLRSG